ncbi:MAG: hypothetical protein KKD09_06010 [Gammaproteobacteria bacterium]|nr:hypothetical protein [Gammaproteobacteria bacterium]
MNTRPFISSLLLVTFASGIGAQSLPRDSEPLSSRPLNLSVRKPVAPVADPAVLPVDKEGQATSEVQPAGAAVVLPYGAGYENRQQGKASGGGGSGGGGSGGGGGGGGGGRGS